MRHPVTRFLHAALRVGALTLCSLAVAPTGLLVGGCASPKVTGTETDQAKTQFEKGMGYVKDENYLEAINTFNVVRTRYPYSSYATLAELRIADAQFALGKYVEAAAAYRSFVRFHPHHPDRAYALYRIGDCYYQQIPGEWWFMPPAYERELGSTTDALRELQTYVEAYPQDKRVPEASKKIRALEKRLAEFELYVARFYWKKEKPAATKLRTEYLLQHYPDAGLSPEALVLLGQSEIKLGQRERAEQAFRRVVRDYPRSPEARQAVEQLEKLPPVAAPAQLPAAAPAPSAAPATGAETPDATPETPDATPETPATPPADGETTGAQPTPLEPPPPAQPEPPLPSPEPGSPTERPAPSSPFVP